VRVAGGKGGSRPLATVTRTVFAEVQGGQHHPILPNGRALTVLAGVQGVATPAATEKGKEWTFE